MQETRVGELLGNRLEVLPCGSELRYNLETAPHHQWCLWAKMVTDRRESWKHLHVDYRCWCLIFPIEQAPFTLQMLVSWFSLGLVSVCIRHVVSFELQFKKFSNSLCQLFVCNRKGSHLTYEGGDTGRIERDVLAYEDAPDTYLPLSGIVQARYDGDGYKAQYLLAPDNISDAGNALQQDIAFFSGHWLTLQTRLLTVEMTWANYHRGGYVSAVYMFEIPPSGYIESSAHLRPFMADSSSASEAADGLELFIFIVLWIWVIGFRVYAEVMKKVSMKRPGYWYLFFFWRLLGHADCGLTSCHISDEGLNTMQSPMSWLGFSLSTGMLSTSASWTLPGPSYIVPWCCGHVHLPSLFPMLHSFSRFSHAAPSTSYGTCS